MRAENKTVLMVTHDVDEAMLLADRIVMMTNGPAATVGEIVTVPFERPRDRLGIVDDPRYHRAAQPTAGLSRRTGAANGDRTPSRTDQPAKYRQLRSHARRAVRHRKIHRF